MEISTSKKYSINLFNGEKSIPVLNELVCELQSILAQYFVVAAIKHIALEEAVNAANLDQITEKKKDIDLFLWEKLLESFSISEKYVLKYYDQRSKYTPRVTIKAPYENNKIIDLYRKDRCPFTEFDINDNTAFKKIQETGRFYICNNIPQAVKDEQYKNKRINGQFVRTNYKFPNQLISIWNKLRDLPEVDSSWEVCWDTDSKNVRPYTESCYKSTLVVPMTLVNASLCREFKEYMFGDTKIVQSNSQYKKLMFGFLCIDHRHINYFNYDLDTRFGYIIADILSLFLVVRLMCTIKSEVYQKAERKLEETSRQ
ncbi:MAG: hypothetical protein GXP60_05140 [Epsilonproteobacteria bacterium]|nr:hypothetical protein [Campylobacterota bacterium]